ncbi:alpha/beta hydrolase fold domain-containing protein [Tundrisphaera lichenicola]|uniref:alpha/beta hydrolase fold domain-containing protein n=1 Tax=Tundrisphaera lichenicola TaxID=2029860 RepID=UPI003EC0F292
MVWRFRWWMGATAALTLLGIAGILWFRYPPPVELDVEYGRANGRPLRLDIYRPAASIGPRPGVLLVHGGGWVQGDKSSERDMGEGLARAGYVAIAVGYRLAGDDANRHPAQVADVRRAARWVRANASRLGIDPNRIGAFGISAGGHLVAMLGTTEIIDDGDPELKGYSSRVNCVVDCCGPTDFTDESSPPLGPESIWMADKFLGRPWAQFTEANRDASPVLHADAKSAPTLIIHGTADTIVPIDQSRRFRDALRKAGVEVQFLELEGEDHIILGPEARARMFREVMAFLRKHLRP